VVEIFTSADVPTDGVAAAEVEAAIGGADIAGGAGADDGAEMSVGATLPHQLTLLLPASMAE